MLGSPPAAVWTPLFMLVHACPPLFIAVQQIYVRLKTPEQATKTTTEIFSVFLLLFSWQVVLVQATFGHNDKAEHG